MKARIKDGNIDGRQALALLMVATSAKVFLLFPRVMVNAAATAGWLLVLISALLAGTLVLVLAKLLAAMGGDYSLEEVAEARLGPGGGLVAGVTLSLLFLADVALTARQFSEALITAVLPETPISVVTAVLFLVALYGAYLGIEALSRVAWLLVPWIGMGVVLGGVLVFPYTRPEQIFPLLGNGLDVLVTRGITGTGFFMELLLILVIRPFLRQPGQTTVVALSATALAGMAMAGVVAQYIMVFPVPTADTVTFPLLQMIRLVFLGRFTQRVEAAYIFVWVITGMLKMGIVLYASALLLARGLGLPVFRPLLFALTLLAFAVSFVPDSMVQAFEWDAFTLRERGWVVGYILPLVLLGMALLARGIGRKGGRVR
ncbi:MAG: GerAB/ArcD/ProY family transporter [Bacillota bacterium]